MTIFYNTVNTKAWVSAPQMVCWRNRWRGYRDSLKINTEINQTGYDIYQLYYLTGSDAGTLDANLYDIEYGVALGAQMFWDTTNTTTTTTLVGSQDMIRRVQDLQHRVTLLEKGGWTN